MKFNFLPAYLLLFLLPVPVFSQSLNFTNTGSWANVGDVDVAGDQITIEAMVFLSGNNTASVNVLSKHLSPLDVNYLFRHSSFELTTYLSGDSGPTQFLQVINPFVFNQNEWYHIAGTYNGLSVKYYVNGCLVTEQPFSGNLVTSNITTAIGNQSNCQCEQYFGKIDELRVWNVCRSEEEINNNMSDLPNPVAETGLVAYYKFDNEITNHQGNAAFDGALVGSAQYSTDEADIQPFAISGVQITNADCDNENNGSFTILSNRPNAEFSLNNIDFQIENTFSDLTTGTYQVFVKSPSGCVIDSTVIIDSDHFYFEINQTIIICDGEIYEGYFDTGVYIDTIPAITGCDSIRTIGLTVLPNAITSVIDTICEGEMYEGYAMSGTYTDVFTAANGCDSTRTLALTVLPNPTSSLSVSICEGEVYEGYVSSGTYVDVFTAANGCDSTRTLMLTVLPNPTTSLSVSICGGEVYEGYGADGMYVDVFTAANGCDSTRTLMLTVLPNPVSSLNATICQGEVFEGYDASGTFTDVFTAANGCDSTRTLMLTVLPTPVSSLNATICQGEVFEGYGASGTYTDVFTAANGCDSTRTLALTVLPSPATSLNTTICQGEIFEGYGSSGIYTDVFTAANGCDSTRVLTLVVLSNPSSTINTAICEGEIFEGYSVSGTYTDVFTSANGCDSTRTLVLSVLPILETSINANLCQGGVYEGYSTSGTYTDVFTSANGCDSIRTLILDVNTSPEYSHSITICEGSVYDFNGQGISEEGVYFETFTTIYGCDSMVTLDVEIIKNNFLGDDIALCSESGGIELESPSENTIWFDNSISKTNTITKSGIYWATILGDNGCEMTDTISVQFNINSFVPNVFSPNNDGINDCFKPYFSGTGFSAYQFRVFDRWGSGVFTTTDPNECWDGNKDGREGNPGAYVYFVEFSTEYCSKNVLKGEVNLIR